MNRMVLVSLAALLVSVFVAAQQKTVNAAPASSPAAACAADGDRAVSVGEEYVWRLRAYEHIDCALAILDDALKTEGAVVTLSREHAEQVRTRVWWARDAAARVGR